MQPTKQSKTKGSPEREHLFGGIYDQVLERLSQAGLQAGDYSLEAIHQAIDETLALEQAAEEMTADEISLLATYLSRDLRSFSYHLHQTGEGVASWLNFDLTFLEQRTIDRLLGLADQSALQRLALFEKLECSSVQYLSGEVCTVGSLRCLNCGQITQFTQTKTIESCRECHSDCFERVSGNTVNKM